MKRRSAIEPEIGHQKAEGKLGKNWLKGSFGDALNPMLCGAGHNLRKILARLRRSLYGALSSSVRRLGCQVICGWNPRWPWRAA